MTAVRLVAMPICCLCTSFRNGETDLGSHFPVPSLQELQILFLIGEKEFFFVFSEVKA